MKVLTIQEPYATLIRNGQKRIETRSWKTKYRGEVYIHAAKGKKYLNTISNRIVLDLIKNIDLNYGEIICKADLVDCILMDKEFLSKIKNHFQNEYILGIYEEGRYAWILENIVILKESIPSKGQLNIWELDYILNKN